MEGGNCNCLLAVSEKGECCGGSEVERTAGNRRTLVSCENCLLRDWGHRSQACPSATALAVNTYIVEIVF